MLNSPTRKKDESFASKWNMSSRLISASVSAFIYLFCLSGLLASPAEQGPIKFKAADYLSQLGPEIGIFIWPAARRFYEVIGDNDDLAESVVQQFNIDMGGKVEMVNYSSFPQISINLYEGGATQAVEEFIAASRLPKQYKAEIAKLDIGANECSFSVSTSRGTWSAAAVLFMDIDRITSERDQRRCLEVGVDYINGFPMAVAATYTDVPELNVRRSTLLSIFSCSTPPLNEGVSEKTKDGITPRPAVSCVIKQLSSI